MKKSKGDFRLRKDISRFSIISFLPLVSTHSFTGKFFDLAISRFGTIFFKVVSEKEEMCFGKGTFLTISIKGTQ